MLGRSSAKSHRTRTRERTDRALLPQRDVETHLEKMKLYPENFGAVKV